MDKDITILIHILVMVNRGKVYRALQVSYRVVPVTAGAVTSSDTSTDIKDLLELGIVFIRPKVYLSTSHTGCTAKVIIIRCYCA